MKMRKAEKKIYLLKEKCLAHIQCILSRLFYLFLKEKIKKEKKNRSKIIVGFHDIYYTGNTRSVFEYMCQFPNKYDCFWVAKNRRSYMEVKKRGGKVYYMDSIVGIPKFLRADAWVIAHKGLRDIPCLPHNDYKILQLWHGIGPKGVVFTQEDYKKYYFCLASEFSKQRHMKLWNAPPDRLYPTGFARMDRLYRYLRMHKKNLLNDVGIKVKDGKKIILYAPTYDTGLWPWGDPYGEFERLCKFCKENNLILILRLHPYAKVNRNKLRRIVKRYDNVYWLDMSEEPDTMKLLAIADILITDWSSIYTDYFLTKRPIIYLEVSPEFFTQKRGKPEIPPEYRAGEIVHNNEEFYKALEFVLEHGNRFAEEQEKLLKIIHGNVDGKASERVIRVIEDLLKVLRS